MLTINIMKDITIWTRKM